jgi:hypothetical protein
MRYPNLHPNSSPSRSSSQSLTTDSSANLVMEWVNGSTHAFPASQSNTLLDGTLGYFAFTSAIYAIGFGLVTLGHWLRNRRRATPEIRLDQPAT